MKVLQVYSERGNIDLNYLSGDDDKADQDFAELVAAWRGFCDGTRADRFHEQTYRGSTFVFHLGAVIAISLRSIDAEFEIAKQIYAEKWKQRVDEGVKKALGRVGFTAT